MPLDPVHMAHPFIWDNEKTYTLSWSKIRGRFFMSKAWVTNTILCRMNYFAKLEIRLTLIMRTNWTKVVSIGLLVMDRLLQLRTRTDKINKSRLTKRPYLFKPGDTVWYLMWDMMQLFLIDPASPDKTMNSGRRWAPKMCCFILHPWHSAYRVRVPVSS